MYEQKILNMVDVRNTVAHVDGWMDYQDALAKEMSCRWDVQGAERDTASTAVTFILWFGAEKLSTQFDAVVV